MKVWDGLRQPGRHLYPPNVFCGLRRQHGNAIDVLRLSSGPEAEVDFYVSNATAKSGFWMEVSYIDMGE